MARRKNKPKTTNRRSPQLCVYCGIRPAVKREHPVGKVFFDKLPAQMITVPSCDECDSGTGDGGTTALHHDEEYMRNMLCMRDDIAETHPVAMKLMNTKVMGSFANSIPLAKSVLKTTKLVNVRTQQGIWLPDQRHVYHVDLDRFRRVVRKIVRGLHYARERKPLSYDAHIEVLPDLTDRDFDMFLSFFAEGWYGLGDKVFVYKAARFPDKPDHGMWLMVFYKSFAVLAATMTKEDAERRQTSR